VIYESTYASETSKWRTKRDEEKERERGREREIGERGRKREQFIAKKATI